MASDKSILVVDDEETFRMVLRQALEDLKFSVVEAEDGYEAFVLLNDKDFCFVVTDLNMPKMNGLCLIQKARELQMQVPFILWTSDPSIRKEDVEAVGGNFFFQKMPENVGNIADEIVKQINLK